MTRKGIVLNSLRDVQKTEEMLCYGIFCEHNWPEQNNQDAGNSAMTGDGIWLGYRQAKSVSVTVLDAAARVDKMS